jgi:hypothetical protein
MVQCIVETEQAFRLTIWGSKYALRAGVPPIA